MSQMLRALHRVMTGAELNIVEMAGGPIIIANGALFRKRGVWVEIILYSEATLGAERVERYESGRIKMLVPEFGASVMDALTVWRKWLGPAH